MNGTVRVRLDPERWAAPAGRRISPSHSTGNNSAVPSAESTTRIEIEAGLERARDHLLSLQGDDGWWKGELETNVTMDAEDLLLREFLGIRKDDETRLAAGWIRSQQRADGTWANYYGGTADLSTTIEAYVALRLAGDTKDLPHMRLAVAYIRREGGLENARVFTRIWMALFGIWSWDDVPAVPPEVVLLPSWFPLNVYDFACWARQTIVALSVVWAHRPVRPLNFDLSEIKTGAGRARTYPILSKTGLLGALDGALHLYEKTSFGPVRRFALRRVERWIVERQEADGSWGGIQPPWVYSLIALHLLGYPFDHPVMKAGLEGLDRFTIVEGGVRRVEACQSPVWDTALAVVALSDAGVPGDDPALVKAADRLLDKEVRVRGDWAVRRKSLDPGGWSFEFENINYPDIDDTAEVVMALRRVDYPDPQRLVGAVNRGVRWVLGMACSDGGWAAFDADNVREVCRDLPFCDFGEVIDDPSADVTAHVVEMLGGEGLGESSDAAGGVEWLMRAQEPEGCWFGRWGANYVYGTGAVVPALIDAGVSTGDPVVCRAVSWLESVQNQDGGWGEDLRSYDDRSTMGIGASTASQTAWALLALLAAKETSAAVERGIAWLLENQRGDGGWDEPWFTGVGFPRDFYINYHLYRIVFPVMALGRYAAACAGRDEIEVRDRRGKNTESSISAKFRIPRARMSSE